MDRIAFAAELLGDRRARTWTAAAWAVRNATGDIRELLETGELAKLRGVGRSTLQVVVQVLAGEKPAALSKFEEKLPHGLFEVRQVKGLGPKKVKRLWKELEITSIGELEYACQENRLLSLSGFGGKTQEKVLAEIARIRSTAGAMRQDQARKILDPIEHALWVLDAVAQVTIVGDLGRGRELVRELAVLVETDDEAAAEAQLERAYPSSGGASRHEVTLHFASAEQFAARSVWLTSSAGHRSRLVSRAASHELHLDENGLRDGAKAAPRCEDERDVYRALSLVPTARERRQDDVPLVEMGKAKAALIRREDLRGALHNHTLASDGSATLEQMRDAAQARELTYLGVTDHSQTASYAGGLDAERLLAQLTTIDALNIDPDACVLLTGVESDILQHGELDYPDEVLAELDVVVASVHRRHGVDPDAMTRRMIAAASHRYTDVIGHPTGRLLLARAASEYDVGAFLDACAEHGVAVELNANPHRLDLNETHLAMAKDRGVLVSIAADAHATRELDNLDYGITIARRAGLVAADVLNAKPLDELKAWIGARRRR